MRIRSKKLKLYFYAAYLTLALFIYLFQLIYIESYEAILSAFCAQEYYSIGKEAFFYDVNLFVLPIISYFNQFYTGTQFFGYFLFFETFLIGLFLLKYILNRDELTLSKRFFIAFSFIILQIPNFLLVSTTRIAVLATFLFYLLYQKEDRFSYRLLIFFFFCVFIRMDAFALLSILYILIQYINKKRVVVKDIFAPLCGIGILMIYKLFVHLFLSEPFNVFYFKELDLMDRQNYLLNKMNGISQVVVEALSNYMIFDEKIYSLDFVNKILATNTSHLSNSIINYQLFINTLTNSLPAIKASTPIILFCLSALIILTIIQRKRIVLHILFFIFPIASCLYVQLPVRFIYPYYLCLTLYIIYVKHYSLFANYSILFGIIGITFLNSYKTIKENQLKSEQFYTTMNKVELLKKEYGDTLYFDNYYNMNWSFENPNICYRYAGNKIHFLNYTFIYTLSNYTDVWKRKGCSEPLSVLEKIEMIEKEDKSLIVGSDYYKEIYTQYLQKRYLYESEIHFLIY